MKSFWDGKRVLVTGASGLIGAALVEELLKKKGVSVVAAGRNLEKLETVLGRCEGVKFALFNLFGPERISGDYDIIVHTAGNASPDLFVGCRFDTLVGSYCGAQKIVQYLYEHRKTKVVCVSSSEVYGNALAPKSGFREEDACGHVDILSPRASYPMGKMMMEAFCATIAGEWNVDISIVRPGHIYGPTAGESDKRVSSMWPRMAARGEDIVMKSDGRQIRSYTYAADCATAIMKVAEKGKRGEAYNIAHPEVKCSIKKFAATVAKAAGVKLRVEAPKASEKKAFNPMLNSTLDASKLLALGWRPKYGVEAGIKETIEALRAKAQ